MFLGHRSEVMESMRDPIIARLESWHLTPAILFGDWTDVFVASRKPLVCKFWGGLYAVSGSATGPYGSMRNGELEIVARHIWREKEIEAMKDFMEETAGFASGKWLLAGFCWRCSWLCRHRQWIWWTSLRIYTGIKTYLWIAGINFLHDDLTRGMCASTAQEWRQTWHLTFA